MHSFVIAIAKPGRDLPPHVLDVLQQEVPDGLHFQPESRLFWTDDAERIAYGGWQAATDGLGIGSHWHVTPDRLTAFTGRPWPRGQPWAAGRSWAEQLADYWRHHAVTSAAEELSGIFLGVSVDRHGRGFVVTDPLGIALLYRAETDDAIVISSRASVGAAVVASPGEQPARDAMGVGWLAFGGELVGDRTGFSGVRVLPGGAYVAIDPRWATRLQWWNRAPWSASPDLTALDRDALVETVRDDLATAARDILALPGGRWTADLTGGKDSRLVLSLLLSEDLTESVAFRTTGLPDMPDAIVSRMLAERFGLRHHVEGPGALNAETFESRLLVHVFHTSGMFGAWNLKGQLGIRTGVAINGLFGELLRSNYAGVKEPLATTGTVDRFSAFRRLDQYPLLREDARRCYREWLTEELEGQLDAGVCTQDAVDAFYARNRLRRWQGTSEEIEGRSRLFPLYSLRGFQAAFALGPMARRNEVLHFEIMRRCNDELTRFPIAKSPWRPPAFAHLDTADAYRAIEPVKATSGGAPAWQITRLEANRDVFWRHLVDDPGNPVFEVVDRSAVQRALRQELPPGPFGPQQLYGALTAAVWLGRHERVERMTPSGP